MYKKEIKALGICSIMCGIVMGFFAVLAMLNNVNEQAILFGVMGIVFMALGVRILVDEGRKSNE